MQQTILYRKRFIPNETICLKDDKIIVKNDAHIITKWNVFRPKLEFSKGVSCYFLKEGYKVSKFLNDDDALVYYYCDIIDTVYDAKENAYYFADLLVDVIIYPDGFVKVVDLAELADALERKYYYRRNGQKSVATFGSTVDRDLCRKAQKFGAIFGNRGIVNGR